MEYKEKILNELDIIKNNPIAFCDDMINVLKSEENVNALCTAVERTIMLRLGLPISGQPIYVNEQEQFIFKRAGGILESIGITKEKVKELTPNSYSVGGQLWFRITSPEPRIVFLQKFMEQLKGKENDIHK